MRYYINGVRVTRRQMLSMASNYFYNVEESDKRLERWEHLARTYGEYGVTDLLGASSWRNVNEQILTERFSFKIFKN